MIVNTDANSPIHYVDCRDTLYYNKYTYRLRAYLPYAREYCESQSLDVFLHQVTHRRFHIERYRKFVDANVILYERYHAWRRKLQRPADLLFRNMSGYLYVFSNDLAMLQDLGGVLNGGLLTQAVPSVVRGVKYFRNKPAHKFRIHLRSSRVYREQYTKFAEFITEHADRLFPSPSLKKHIRDSIKYGGFAYAWLNSSHYFDYDTESLETWLDLRWGDMLGKHYELRKYEAGVDE